MSESNRTLTELHDRIVYLWENKQYGTYSLGTPQNHLLKINTDDTLNLTHDNAFIDTTFNPSNNVDSVRKFLKSYLQSNVYN